MKFFSPAAPHRHPCLTLHSWNWRKRKNCSLHFLSTQDAKFLFTVNILYGLPRWHRAKKNPPANAGGMGSNPGLARFPWSKKWQPTPAFLPGESHGQRSLQTAVHGVTKESDTAKHRPQWVNVSFPTREFKRTKTIAAIGPKGRGIHRPNTLSHRWRMQNRSFALAAYTPAHRP